MHFVIFEGSTKQFSFPGTAGLRGLAYFNASSFEAVNPRPGEVQAAPQITMARDKILVEAWTSGATEWTGGSLSRESLFASDYLAMAASLVTGKN